MTRIKQHNLDVRKIQMQMENFYALRRKVKIYHGSTNSTRTQNFKKDEYVDVSQFDRIIEINTNEHYILVEPNVPMDKLVTNTLQHKLVPPVVMEFPGITVGGGIQGGAGESSSFRYGLFNETCLEYEIVLGNGQLITASPTQNQDLFYGTAGSYGSLGIITLVKLRLIPAQPFVHLTYHTVKSFGEVVSLMDKTVQTNPNFIDAIMFGKDRGVIMIGTFSDKKEMPISNFRRAWDQWFYIHADQISHKYSEYEEIIPIRDYLFRYDRGAFWMGKYAFRFLKLPFNRFARFVFNRFCKTRELYHSLHSVNISQRYLIQDIVVPKKRVVELLEYIARVLIIYPIWLVPLKPTTQGKLAINLLETDLVISVGIWGELNQSDERLVEINRDLEKAISNMNGRKWLYAHQYYTHKEFWQIYDHQWYNELRDKYFADSAFPDIYDKTKVMDSYKPSVLQALLKYTLRIIRIPVS